RPPRRPPQALGEPTTARSKGNPLSVHPGLGVASWVNRQRVSLRSSSCCYSPFGLNPFEPSRLQDELVPWRHYWIFVHIMRVAGLFAGIGGFELGLSRAGHHAQLLCDVLPASRAVLE